MTRVITAEGMRELDSPRTGRRYYAGHRDGDKRAYLQGGSFDVDPADVGLVVKMGGAVASLTGATRAALGWRCQDCGFGSYFRLCGRCKSENTVRESS
jgi:hypothetical protein